MNRRLYRSRSERRLSGVAGGVAEYLDVDPSIVRVIWALLAIITGGVFLVIYGVMWLAVPEAPYGSVADGGGAADAEPGVTRPWHRHGDRARAIGRTHPQTGGRGSSG